MPKITRKEIIAKLEALGVEVDAEFTTDELFKLLKKSEADKGEDDANEEEDDESETGSATNTSAPSKVVFTLRNGNFPTGTTTRIFSSETHGADFMELASSFETANTLMKVENENDKDEVAKAKAWNFNVKHPILKKEVAQ